MGIDPVKLTSPAKVYEECVLDHMSIPTMYDSPEENWDAYEYASRIMNREWRCVYQIGHWNETYDYDLQFAYPSVAAQLYDTRRAEFIHSKEYVKAHWGFLYGEIDITADLHPVVSADGGLYKGKRDDYISQDMVQFIEKRGLGSFKLKDGWFLKFFNSCTPLEVAMNRLFDLRGAGGLREHLAKKFAQSVYGKFSEEHADGTYGWHYNPIYAAMITTRVPIRVADFIYQNNAVENVISVIVDGCLMDKNVVIPTKYGIGLWKASPASPALVLSQGLQFHNGKKPAGLSYDEMMAGIREKPRSRSYFGIDLTLLELNRKFDKVPHSGEQLITNVYKSKSMEVV